MHFCMIECNYDVIYLFISNIFDIMILLIIINNDNMHWACWPLRSICNFEFLKNYPICFKLFSIFSKVWNLLNTCYV